LAVTSSTSQPVNVFLNLSRESNTNRTRIDDDDGDKFTDAVCHDDDDAVDESRYHTNDHDAPLS